MMSLINVSFSYPTNQLKNDQPDLGGPVRHQEDVGGEGDEDAGDDGEDYHRHHLERLNT